MFNRWVFPIATTALFVSTSFLSLHAQEGPQPPDQPEPSSAELVIDAEEPTVAEPAPYTDDHALPPLDHPNPASDNFFDDNFFAQPDFSSQDNYTPEPVIPERPPLIEDSKENNRKQRIQLRKIKATLDRDPQLIELQEMADNASTPEDRRAARRAYFALFFQKVRKADPNLSNLADELEKTSLANLYQTRIEPTLALTPPPQPQPQLQFIPKRQYEEESP